MSASPWRHDHDQNGSALHLRPMHIPMALRIHCKHLHSVVPLLWHENMVCFSGVFLENSQSKLLTHGCRERKRPRPPKFRERDDEREQRIEQKTLRVWRLLMWDWHILSAAGTLSRWWKLFSHFVSICGRIGHILMSSRHLKTLENPHGGVSCSTKKCHLCILLLKASLVQRWLSGQHAETKWLRQQTLQLLDICWRKLKSPCEG